jgi:hypothetical protein
MMEYFPFTWFVSPGGPTESRPTVEATCKTSDQTLVTFAVVNIVIAAVTIIFGNTRVMQMLSCGWLGKPKTRISPVSGLIGVGLQVVANIAIAFVIKGSPGFENGFEVWQLLLFLLARPRIAWLVSLFMSPLESWRQLAFKQASTEVGLQLASLYTFAKVVAFASSRSYYSPSQSIPSWARLTYVGALLWIVCLPLSLVSLLYILFALRREYSTYSLFKTWLGLAAIGISCIIWISSWMFIAGFIYLAGIL